MGIKKKICLRHLEPGKWGTEGVFWVNASRGFGFRREGQYLEVHCFATRGGRSNQRPILHTETAGEHKIKSMSQGCLTHGVKSKESKGLIKSEVKGGRGGNKQEY